MSKLVLRYNHVSEVIELHFNNKDLQDFLSHHTSQSARTWYKANKCWTVLPEVLGEVISYARHIFSHIDSSSIPPRHQTIVQKALQGIVDEDKSSSKNNNINTNKNLSPYSILYITSDAPDFIIKAAYKALAFKHHPDRGGDANKFQQVREAYESLKGG